MDRRTAQLILILAATMLFSFYSSPVQARLIEKVVAVVNGEVITQTELNTAGKKDFIRLRQSTPVGELEEAMNKARRQVLANLIEDLLVSQKADELGIKITEQALNSTIARISRDNNLTEAELYQELARTGTSRDQYRKDLSTQLLHSRLVNYEVKSRIVISEMKARAYYDTVFSKQKTAEGYHILQIGISRDPSDSSSAATDKARRRTEGLRKLALAGQDFKELARSFSELPSAKDGGDLGFFNEDEMAESMRKIIIALKPGQVSEIIESRNSFQFYQLLVKNINGILEFSPFEDVSEEIFELLRKEELNTRYKEWLDEIKNQAIIKELI